MVYKLEVKANDFKSDTVCMGWQLIEILRNFECMTDVEWLIFDVYGTTHRDLSQLFEINETGEIIFESTKDLISSVEQVIQFEQGVFCLVPNSEEIQFIDGPPETESPEGMQIKGSLLEIRTFDYSFFEIYSRDKDCLEKIKNNCSLQKNLIFKGIDNEFRI